jgi:hypothetical protein
VLPVEGVEDEEPLLFVEELDDGEVLFQLPEAEPFMLPEALEEFEVFELLL